MTDFDIYVQRHESVGHRRTNNVASRLVWMRGSDTPNPTLGMRLLYPPDDAGNLSVIDHDIYVYPDSGMTESIKFRFLNGELHRGGQQPGLRLVHRQLGRSV